MELQRKEGETVPEATIKITAKTRPILPKQLPRQQQKSTALNKATGNRSENEEWTTVMNSNRRARNRRKSRPERGKGGNAPSNNPPTRKIVKGKIKLPRSAAVVVTPNAEKGLTRTEIIREARSKIKIEDLGIEYIRPKIAATGAVILEIPGEAGAHKADGLASRLREIFDEGTARISRPVKRADLRIAGLDESVTTTEIAAEMAKIGGCPAAECKIGAIRRGAVGLGIAWVNCPAVAAKKLAEAARIKIGWVRARVEVLSPRPLLCYRCLEPGHTRARCTAQQDRSNRCYRCGQSGHTAKGCTEKPSCPLCSDLGRPAGYRLGSAACAPPKGEDNSRKTRRPNRVHRCLRQIIRREHRARMRLK